MDFDFKIGAPVFAREEEIGRLKYLVVDPEEETITNLVVEKGRLLHKDMVVPVSWVERADEQRVVLNASVREVEALPDFREVEFQAPDPAAQPIAGHPAAETLVWIPLWQSNPHVLTISERPRVSYRGRLGVSEDEVVVRRGQPVYTSDGQRVATLDHVRADDKTHRIQQLIVHRGQWLQRGEDLIVPADAVTSISGEDIRLRLSREELDQLHRYHPPMGDGQLEAAITRGLQTQPETSGGDLRVQVDRGLVRLFGEVSDEVAAAAQALAGKLQGVVGVEDHTARAQSADGAGGAPAGATAGNGNTLAAQISDAFRRQRQEDLSNVRVQVDQGVAHLSGTTPHVAGKALAGQIAQTAPGVKSVVNDSTPDTVVRARVEAALAADARTASVPIDVISVAGVVTLIGKVPSAEVKQAAEQLARATPGVRAVISELEVCPPADDDLQLLTPTWQQVPR